MNSSARTKKPGSFVVGSVGLCRQPYRRFALARLRASLPVASAAGFFERAPIVLRCCFLTTLFGLLMGCHGGGADSDTGKSETRVIQMPEMSKDIKVPTKIWDLVTGASFETSIRQSSNFIFAPIKVKLEEKTPGVLSDPTVRLEFPKAGGEVDFAKYVKSDRGTFKISFEFDGFSDADSLKVYYVSRARKRKIDNEVYGSGCHEFFDVKDYVTQVNAKDGFVVNVTRDRHDSAVGGHFLFSYKKDKQTLISQVTFTDSKRPDLFCQVNER